MSKRLPKYVSRDTRAKDEEHYIHHINNNSL